MRVFFMIGVTDGRKDFEYGRVLVCEACGRYSRYAVFMTYTSLLMFFIPCFKWNRHYYAQSACCGALYEIDPEIGRRIAAGENIELKPENMKRVYTGGRRKRCRVCNYETDEDFEFCPKCGNRF